MSGDYNWKGDKPREYWRPLWALIKSLLDPSLLTDPAVHLIRPPGRMRQGLDGWICSLWERATGGCVLLPSGVNHWYPPNPPGLSPDL